MFLFAILQKFGECDEKEARDALLKCIYETESVTSTLLDSSISQHISRAVKRQQVANHSFTPARAGITGDGAGSTPT